MTATGTVHAKCDLLTGAPALGSVQITVNTENQQIRDPAGNVVFSGPVTVSLVDGEATFLLPASDDATLEPHGFTYTAVEQLRHVAAANYRSVVFQVATSGVVHLADMAATSETVGDPEWGTSLNALTARVAALESGEGNDLDADVDALIEDQDSATRATLDELYTGGEIVDFSQDLGPFAAGKGILLTSPDGDTVRRVAINNDGTVIGEDPYGPTGYQAAVLDDAPIAYWRLGESSGTTAADQMGDHPGTYAGGVTLGTPGLLSADTNKAITLDGVDDHVVVKADGAILSGLTNWTFEAIVHKTSADRTLYSERGSSGSDILNISIGSKAKLTYRDHAGTIDQPEQTSSMVLPDETHHVVITKSGTTVKFYVDGTLDGTVTLTAGNTFGEATVQSWIGGDPADGSQWFAGVVDEVALYDYALLSGRITAHVAEL